MKFKDIPQFTRSASYKINVGWDYLEQWIKHQQEDKGMAHLDLDPDFQRAHVWTEEQQRHYVEYILRGGVSSRVILFNCVGWMNSFKGPFVLVDGKQRLDAVLRFLHNELDVFKVSDCSTGSLYKDFVDPLPHDVGFEICINDLATRAQVLQWYLDINTGGVVHTNDEIEKVKALLNKERH